MKYRLRTANGLTRALLASFAVLAWLPTATLAQTPVDENGKVIGDYDVQLSEPATGNEGIPLLSSVDLEELVGPIALYPDDLLAVVLPASAYPLQIVDAARFLEALKTDPSLEPDPQWDDSIVALINYPEVVELLNDDIDWTWRLGEAVVSQQSDVVAAIETFRDRAYAAGNLKSDSYQNVSRDEGIIEIVPIDDDVIYVPYYEPERVIVYQPRPAYYYYPRPYPVYYYPYSSSHAFDRGYFWGLTTAFTIGWHSDRLNVFHHSYYGHPYFGHSYWNRWWYRRPSVNIHNTTYGGNRTRVTVNRYSGGDRWQPRSDRRDYASRKRVTRHRYSPRPGAEGPTRRAQQASSQRQVTGDTAVRRENRRESARHSNRASAREQIEFRKRPQAVTTNRREPVQSRERTQRSPPQANGRERTSSRQRIGRATPENADIARQQRRQAPTGRRVDVKSRQSEPTPKLRRTDPVVRERRAEQAPRVRRAEPAQRQKAERKSAPTVQTRNSSDKSAVRSSRQKSARRSDRR